MGQLCSKEELKRFKDEWIKLGLSAGCTPDQLRNFRYGEYLAQSKQLQFHSACRECDKENGPTEIGFGGARGPGKSHALLAQLALDDCQRTPRLKCLLLRKVGRSGKEGFEDLRLDVIHLPHEYNRSNGVTYFPNGSRIFLGHFQNESDVDKYLGLEYDIIALEEATTLTYSKFEAIRTCCRTSKDNWRPRLYLSCNPGGTGHQWFKSRFIVPSKNQAETETRFIFATVDDNIFVNRDYIKNLDNLTGWKLRAWRFGDWDVFAGQFFTNFHYDTHTMTPGPVPEFWETWLAMDYGWVHNNVVLLLGKWQEMVYVIDEVVARKQLPETNAHDVQLMLDKYKVHPKFFVAGADAFSKDGTSGVSVADKWKQCGFHLTPANMDRVQGAAEVMSRLGDTERGIAPTLKIFKNCTRLLETIPVLEHDPHRPEDVLKVNADANGMGGDDAYDTLRYGLMEAARKKQVYGYSGPGR